MSQPTKLSPELTAQLLSLLRSCVPIETACRACGITSSCLLKWRKRGRREPDSVYADLDRAVTEAIAHAEIEMVKTVYNDAAHDVRSAQWMLERRFQGRWSPKNKSESKVEHSAKAGSGVMVYIPSNGRD